MDIARSTAQKPVSSPAVITVYVSAPPYYACVLEAERLNPKSRACYFPPVNSWAITLKNGWKSCSGFCFFLLPLLMEILENMATPRQTAAPDQNSPDPLGRGCAPASQPFVESVRKWSRISIISTFFSPNRLGSWLFRWAIFFPFSLWFAKGKKRQKRKEEQWEHHFKVCAQMEPF